MKYFVKLIVALTLVSVAGCGPSKGTTDLNAAQGKMDPDAAPSEGV